MYIQITTRCNMTCEHCCMRATAKGEDMERNTFLEAIRLADSFGDHVTIGGGEPTLHPYLFDFIGWGLGYTDKGMLCVITNGKLKEPALKLAKLAREGVLGAELSIDQWHDRISHEVQTAFTREDRYSYQRDYNDHRGIRSVTSIVKMGRAEDNEIYTEKGCACDDLFVAPDGTLWSCAHREEQFGDVWSPEIPDDYFGTDYKCSRKRLGTDDEFLEEEEEEEEEELVTA